MPKPNSKHADLAQVVSGDPEIHGGELVFSGTRVPVKTLMGHIEDGDSMEQSRQRAAT